MATSTSTKELKPAEGKADDTPKPAKEIPPWKSDAWLEDLAQRCWTPAPVRSLGSTPAPWPDIDERLLAIGFEMGKLERDSERLVKEGSNKTFAYHSIDQVENTINELQVKYRVRITPSVTSFANLEGGVILSLHFKAHCWQTEQDVEWDWVDDGQDMSKAGAFAVKYGLLRYFGVGDGSIDVAEEIGGKSEIRGGSTTQARTSVPRNGTKPADQGVKDNLYKLAKLLPKDAGWPFKDDGSNIKIDAMLRSKMDPSNIEKLIREAMAKAGVSEPEQTAGGAPTSGYDDHEVNAGDQ